MNRILNLLGLMMRAGKLVTGEDLIIKNIQERKLKLLIISEDCGKNTKKKLADKANHYAIKTITILTINEISDAIGKENRVALGLIDKGFSDKFIELLEEGGYINNEKN